MEYGGLQGLKEGCELGVEVYVVVQVAGQPQVVLKRIQCFRVVEKFYSSELFF